MPFSLSNELPEPTVSEKERMTELSAILTRNGMELRDDSQLAFRYIQNGGDPSLVAHEMLCTNFLYHHTRYNALCQQQLRSLANMVHETYSLPWDLTWKIVVEYGVPAMKMYALAESGLFMPDFDVLNADPS